MLRTVRTPADDQDLFVPQIAVTLAFLLAVISVFGLVIFLAHLAKEIRVETMLATVHQDATAPCNMSSPKATRSSQPPTYPDLQHTAFHCWRRRQGSWSGSTSPRCSRRRGRPTRS